MWHFFIDLDATLWLRRDCDYHLTQYQSYHLDNRTIGNASTGTVYSNHEYIKPSNDRLCSPIHQVLHQGLFSTLCQSEGVSFSFITAADYDPRTSKALLSIFFANSLLEQKAIIESDFYNYHDLILAIGKQSGAIPPEKYTQELAKGKALVMNSVFQKLEKNSSNSLARRNLVLIDDNPLNRQYALQYGFQVIDPSTENYPSVLMVFILNLSDASISSPDRDQAAEHYYTVKSIFP